MEPLRGIEKTRARVELRGLLLGASCRWSIAEDVESVVPVDPDPVALSGRRVVGIAGGGLSPWIEAEGLEAHVIVAARVVAKSGAVASPIREQDKRRRVVVRGFGRWWREWPLAEVHGLVSERARGSMIHALERRCARRPISSAPKNDRDGLPRVDDLGLADGVSFSAWLRGVATWGMVAESEPGDVVLVDGRIAPSLGPRRARVAAWALRRWVARKAAEMGITVLAVQEPPSIPGLASLVELMPEKLARSTWWLSLPAPARNVHAALFGFGERVLRIESPAPLAPRSVAGLLVRVSGDGASRRARGPLQAARDACVLRGDGSEKLARIARQELLLLGGSSSLARALSTSTGCR